MKTPNTESLVKIYGESEKSAERFASLAQNFTKIFEKEDMEFFTAPGRTEIIGNHTDHNGGMILAGSITLDTIAAAAPNGTSVIRIVSEGYEGQITHWHHIAVGRNNFLQIVWVTSKSNNEIINAISILYYCF